MANQTGGMTANLGYDPSTMGLGNQNFNPASQSVTAQAQPNPSGIGATSISAPKSTPSPATNYGQTGSSGGAGGGAGYGNTSAAPAPTQTQANTAPAQSSVQTTGFGFGAAPSTQPQQDTTQHIAPLLPDSTLPYQEQIQNQNSLANANAQSAAAQAAQRAAATGTNQGIANGQAQYAASEALGKGAQTTATLGSQEAQARAAQAQQQYTNDQQAKATKVQQLKDMLMTDGTSAQARSALIDQIRQLDPNDTLVSTYDHNPSVFADQFSALDLQGQAQRSKVATAAMQQYITNPMDANQVENYWKTGQFQQTFFPDQTKAQAEAASWTPSQSDIDAYNKANGTAGTAYDPTSPQDKLALYEYSTFQKTFQNYAASAITDQLAQQLTSNGIDIGSTQADLLKQYSGQLAQSLTGKNVTVDGQQVAFNADYQNGALAPVFQNALGQAYGTQPDGTVVQPTQWDKNFASLYYATNSALQKNGVSTGISWSDFKNQYMQQEQGDKTMQTALDQNTVNNLANGMSQTFLNSKNFNPSETAATAKTNDDLMALAKTATSPKQLLDMNTTQAAALANTNDADVIQNLAKVGVYTPDAVKNIPSHITDMSQFAANGINPGTMMVTQNGLVKVTGVVRTETDHAFGHNEFGWILQGVDQNGNQVNIASGGRTHGYDSSEVYTGANLYSPSGIQNPWNHPDAGAWATSSNTTSNITA